MGRFMVDAAHNRPMDAAAWTLIGVTALLIGMWAGLCWVISHHGGIDERLDERGEGVGGDGCAAGGLQHRASGASGPETV